MQLTIERGKWMRGATSNPCLYDPQFDKYDALGFYLSAMGYSPYALAWRSSPATLFDSPYGPSPDKEVEWMLNYHRRDTNSALVSRILAINDDPYMGDEERERMVEELFKEAGVEVTFV